MAVLGYPTRIVSAIGRKYRAFHVPQPCVDVFATPVAGHPSSLQFDVQRAPGAVCHTVLKQASRVCPGQWQDCSFRIHTALPPQLLKTITQPSRS